MLVSKISGNPSKYILLQINRSTDIWSLGVIVYNMATGDIPYRIKDKYLSVSRKMYFNIFENIPKGMLCY